MKDWKIIICDKDLNIRVGKHSTPKVINHKEFLFYSKEELLPEYNKLIKKYIKVSYDWKGHSQGAIKFYHQKGKNDILTQLLVHYKNEEVMEGLFD